MKCFMDRKITFSDIWESDASYIHSEIIADQNSFLVFYFWVPLDGDIKHHRKLKIAIESHDRHVSRNIIFFSKKYHIKSNETIINSKNF